ncbi:unannotated protein [freshwater metagenome]|uniref:Unannotated protein n=1 Tax=freshwater metagenome TaxID=449393 RepID=A0A6J6GNJ1_9ZZZZ|nr:TetR family transcriptional regulator [Actinomycetota bacterium]MSZ96622.1 TetR family transcriptional regulator [Actinomycetota bacterium]
MSTAQEISAPRSRTDAEMKLITAAADMLGEVGPRAMTVRGIAERAGVNHGLVHHYFGSKDALAEAAMLHLVQQHANDVREQSHGNPIPAPLALNDEPRYLRAVVRSVLDGELELATTELTAGVSIPRSALQHATKIKKLEEPDLESKAITGMGMALEMGWAALEPFIFSITDVQEKDQEEVREIVRRMRNSLIEEYLSQ